MSLIINKRAALLLALIVLCNNTRDRTDSGGVQAQLLDGEEQELGLIGSRQVGFEPAAEFGDSRGLLSARFRRQVSIPEGSPFQQPQQQQPSGLSNPLGFLQQVGAAQLAQSLQPSGQSSSNQMATALMSQLGDMVRSSQNAQKQAMDTTRQNVQSASQATQQAAQSAQSGIQGALTDIGAGLQRIAANNPNLLPDVKNLYQTVSSKLTSASSSVAQAASPNPSGQQQFAQGIASQIANPQPIPSS